MSKKRILVHMDKCLGCKSCELACAINRSTLYKSLWEGVKEKTPPISRIQVLGDEERAWPLQCKQCEEAVCLNGCPSGALKRSEEGVIYVEEDRCIFCYTCMILCPLGSIIPSHSRKTMVKCDVCYDREYPFCVDACPTGALEQVADHELEDHLSRRQISAWKTRLQIMEEKTCIP